MSELGAAIGANDDPTTVETWLNTGHPLLNDALSGSYHGGFPGGRMVEMFGESSSGKTAIATEVMKCAQQLGGVAAFFDHENSFDHHLAEQNGLNVNDRWIFKTPDTFEQSIDIAVKAAAAIRDRKLIDKKAPIVFVFDSLASMVPRSKLDKETSEYSMHDNTALARATSAAFPALAKFCQSNQFTAMFLNQVRKKPGVTYGDDTSTPGGQSMEFYASVRVQLSRTMLKDSKDKKNVLGQTVKAFMKKNKVHRPFERAEWDFTFREDGTGFFDPIGATIDYLVKEGALEKGGNFIKWDDKKLYRADLIKRINDSGDREQLYKLLPGWDDDRAEAKSVIDWNQF
ncbi:MAG: hypothetical protein KI788_03970 [Mameliella sp.]|nr:hypothetical protein [Mameliella sp.]